MMNDPLVSTFTGLVAQTGPTLANNTHQAQALLEATGAFPRPKIQALLDVIEIGMAADLYQTGGRLPLASLARRLADTTGQPEDLALWALQAWCAALVPDPQPPDLSEEMTLQLAPGISLALRFIPGGTFLYTEHQRPARLNSFWMGKYPVSVAQFRAFLDSPSGRGLAPGVDGLGPDHPVANVTWSAAAAFCAWAGRLCHKDLRLPTEVEWEKAARGTDGREFPWGQQANLLTHCNFGETFGHTTPVGYYSPGGDSPYGCADMAGNVWEWCADEYVHQPGELPLPTGAAGAASPYRVLRGGSWDSEWPGMRTYYRGRARPDEPDATTGFRCCHGNVRDKKLR